MTPFRRQFCYADVSAARHGKTIQSFLDDVTLPAIRKVKERIAGRVTSRRLTSSNPKWRTCYMRPTWGVWDREFVIAPHGDE